MNNYIVIIFLLIASSAYAAPKTKGIPGHFIKCKVVSFDQEKMKLLCGKKNRFIPRSKVKSDLTEGSIVTVLSKDLETE
ncbi:MAG: hypothetical protein KGQ59_03640 [Bdellovibrionales bacterium]|nr:hypothetical protein [Bdellovibrionales bacterium]